MWDPGHHMLHWKPKQNNTHTTPPEQINNKNNQNNSGTNSRYLLWKTVLNLHHLNCLMFQTHGTENSNPKGKTKEAEISYSKIHP